VHHYLQSSLTGTALIIGCMTSPLILVLLGHYASNMYHRELT